MYKDKDKQREANAERQRRYRKALLTTSNVMEGVTPEEQKALHSAGVTDKALPTKQYADVSTKELAEQFYNYKRRGKGITKFEHLPPDVQATIDRLSTDEQEHERRTAIAIDYQHKQPDHYECHSIGVVPVSNPIPVTVCKPGDADYKPLCAFTRDWQAAR